MELFPKRIRELSFWHYQIAGWLSMAILQVFVTTATVGRLDDRFLFNTQLSVLLGFSFTSLLRFVYRRVIYQRASVFPLALMILACSLAVAVLVVACFVLVQILVFGELKSDSGAKTLLLFSLIAYTFPDKLAWSALYFGIKFWRDWQDERELAERASEEAQHAQLQALRYQLNPRFLFDALNSVRALVDEDSRGARQVVSELSEFLRYSLVSRNKPFVALDEELEAVRLYLSVEKRRYEEKLGVTYEIAEDTRELMVPSFLIYPLVEHALRSGMLTSRGCVRLSILTQLCGDTLELAVVHSGKEPKGGADEGKLEMMKARLREFFADRYRLTLIEEESETILKLELPLMSEDVCDHEAKSDHC